MKSLTLISSFILLCVCFLVSMAVLGAPDDLVDTRASCDADSIEHTRWGVLFPVPYPGRCELELHDRGKADMRCENFKTEGKRTAFRFDRLQWKQKGNCVFELKSKRVVVLRGARAGRLNGTFRVRGWVSLRQETIIGVGQLSGKAPKQQDVLSADFSFAAVLTDACIDRRCF